MRQGKKTCETLKQIRQQVASLSMGLAPLASYGQAQQHQQTVAADTLVATTQQTEKATNANTHIFGEIRETMPSFPGGRDALKDFLKANVRYPKKCAKAGIQGRVVVNFIVEEDGGLSNFKVIKSVHPLLDKEALRVAKMMPRFSPGKRNGKAVRVKYSIPVTFRLNQLPH